MNAKESLKYVRSIKCIQSSDYVQGIFDNFIELHGDGINDDDCAIGCGICELCGMPVYVIYTRKGNNIEERIKCNFGSVSPFGYRKVIRIARKAEKFHRPLIIFIDTIGACCNVFAEQNGQSKAISECIKTMGSINTLNIAIITGESESGGGLALAHCNEVWMLDKAIYSVISPECCSAILWNSDEHVSTVIEELGITSKYALTEGFVDWVINTEDGFKDTCENIKTKLVCIIKKYYRKPYKNWKAPRCKRFRKF